MLLVVSACYEISRYGNRFSHDPGKTFEQWTIHKSLVMTVVKQSRKSVQTEGTLNFPQFTSSFVASVKSLKTEKNFTQELIEDIG